MKVPMKKRIPIIAVVLLATACVFDKEEPPPGKEEIASEKVTSPPAKVAKAFLLALSPENRKKALLPFSSENRYDWHYFPRSRRGLAVGDMTADEKARAFELVKTCLSKKGWERTKGVVELEKYLYKQSGRAGYRDPGLYYFTIYGVPSDTKPWGWRLEGHHLSLNFTNVSGKVVSVTPSFMGANPGNQGSGAGYPKVLYEEEMWARKLMKSLAGEKWKKALISSDTFGEIVTGADRKARLEKFSGLSYQEMGESERKELKKLILLYLNRMELNLADRRWKKIEKAGLDKIHFAWAGGLKSGTSHYYRIHGPTFLIEYDNSQNSGNHIHTVWRDFQNDYGEDVLKKHYDRSHRGR